MHATLHVGLEKTGTTSIQNLLKNNSKILLKNKYFFSNKLGFPSNIYLAAMSIDSSRKNDLMQILNIQNEKLLGIKLDEIKRNYKKDISKIDNSYSSLISSEHLQSLLINEFEILNLQKLLINIGFTSFTIIAFIRPPIEILRSRISTAYKNGNFAKPPLIHEPWVYKRPQVYKLLESFQMWINVFGKENVIIKPYSKDLILDFLKVTKINKVNLKIPPKRQNKSMSYELMCALFRNKEIINKVFNNRNEKMRFIRNIYNSFDIENGNKICITADDIEKYNNAFSEDNKFFLENYGFSINSRCDTDEYQKIDNKLLEYLEAKIRQEISKI